MKRCAAFTLALIAAPSMALSIARPSGQLELQFLPGETRLSNAAQVMLARQLPRVYVLNVDLMMVEVPYTAGRRSQALQRAAAIADFYEKAGIPRARIHTDVRPGSASSPATIEWLGFCKPERQADCEAEYFSRPAAPTTAASQPAQNPPATSP